MNRSKFGYCLPQAGYFPDFAILRPLLLSNGSIRRHLGLFWLLDCKHLIAVFLVEGFQRRRAHFRAWAERVIIGRRHL